MTNDAPSRGADRPALLVGLLLLAQDVTVLRRPTVNAIYWVERKIKAWRTRPGR